MDLLLLAAKEYSKLLGKIYLYTLETGVVLQVEFAPGYFHHLLGLQKLTDIPQVIKNPRAYIYRNIINGKITLNHIQRSKYFNEIESRLRHFPQINRLIEFEKVIVDFDPSLINSKLTKADYVLYKRSNDNMFLNLFLMTDGLNRGKQIPLTFLPESTGYYTHGQKTIKVLSMIEMPRAIKAKPESK